MSTVKESEVMKAMKYCTSCLYYVDHARWSNSLLGTLHECKHSECECQFNQDHVRVLMPEGVGP